MTKTTHKRLESALNHLKKCNGDCVHCKYCSIHFTNNNNNSNYIFFAPFCSYGILDDYFNPVSDSLKEMRPKTIEAIEFELN